LEIRQLVASKYDIHYSTIPIETTPCEQAAEGIQLRPDKDLDHASHEDMVDIRKEQ
jgi:cobalt-zinc-cadmium efflux system protein